MAVFILKTHNIRTVSGEYNAANDHEQVSN